MYVHRCLQIYTYADLVTNGREVHGELLLVDSLKGLGREGRGWTIVCVRWYFRCLLCFNADSHIIIVNCGTSTPSWNVIFIR
jgi:hypothetical protein